MTYNVLDYGAAGDGAANDAAAIQTAIDACAATGGGRVLLPGGRVYRAGTIVLKSYVELHLESGAVLKGSDHLEDYNLFGTDLSILPGQSTAETPSYEKCDYSGSPVLFFLYAMDCEFVSITGLGTIDGNEEIFYGKVTPWHIDGAFYPRVPLLFLEDVRHLCILHVTLRRSAFWTTHMVGCSDVLIDGIRILNNLRLANCDGIDPDHCKNVRIVNCHIECADDCIVFKNTKNAAKYGPCENIVVADCTLTSTSAAIKFGTESEALFKNILIANCNISRTNRGISLQLRDCGNIENVTFSNLNIETRLFSKDHWWGKAEPIAITALNRNAGTAVGHIRNIRFQNISCDGENGILIYGEPSRNIQDIHFDNVSVRLRKVTDWPKDSLDLRPCESAGILKASLHGLFIRNAGTITFQDFTLEMSPELAESAEKPISIADCGQVLINGTQQPI